MFLPEAVQYCIRTLEAAGYEAYAVGGCVRDSLLGLTPHDYDLCTNALPEETAKLFSGCTLVRSGEKHGTIGVVMDKQVYEITTFRTEGGYQDSRHPDWVRFVPSLEEDLARRDFTVNAMAYSPTRGYIDPWGGQQDLENNILRAVGDPTQRFTEDALRILRGVRFAVRFRLMPDAQTAQAMVTLVPLVDKLARERVFDELCKLLPLVNAEDMRRYQPVLTQVFPELRPTVNFQQHNPHHAYDVYTHTAYVVQAAPRELPLRLAALLHDVGKPSVFYRDEQGKGHFPNHAEVGADMADAALLRLKAPTALRQQVVTLVRHHMTPMEPDKRILRRRMGKFGIDGAKRLLALQRADFCSKGTGETTDVFDRTAALIEEILAENSCLQIGNLAVNGHDLMALGLQGKQIGSCLQTLLEQVLDEKLPNETEALLQAVKQIATDKEDIL